MKKILSLSALFVISIALFMATLGNGLVIGKALADKVGPACKSFENRNNPIKDMGALSGDFPYAEECKSKGKNFDRSCAYGSTSEEDAKELRLFLGDICKKPNQ